MGQSGVEPQVKPEVIKLPVGVLRKYTEKGMQFERFVFPSNPYHMYGSEQIDFCYGIDFDDTEDGGMDKAMEDRFNLIYTYSNDEFLFPHDKSFNEVILTWTFTITVEGVRQIELLNRIVDCLGDRGVFKCIAELTENSDNDVWDIIMGIMTEMKKASIPELIPYGYSEVSYRTNTPANE